MKRLLLSVIIAVALCFAIWASFGVKTALAQCDCGCVMTCGNNCQWDCNGCSSATEATQMGRQCCVGARAATGDTGPCTLQDGY